MELIPAPGRQLKTISDWLAIALIVLDAVHGLLLVFGDLHLMRPEALAATNATIAALILVAKRIRQQIAVTPEQKVAMVEAAAAAPVKVGHEDPAIAVIVNNPPPPKGLL